jgi:hypothetical protein
MTEGYGHTIDFWRNFRYILSHATKINIYDSVNYAYNPVKYCGMTINYNPLYDETL